MIASLRICLIWSVSALFIPILLTSALAQPWDRTLYVASQNPAASDANEGTENSPLLTIQEGVRRAVANKRNHTSTRIRIEAGTYRERVNLTTYTNYPENGPNDTPILVEAVEPGTVVLSGSDVWTGWQPTGSNYVNEWPYDWGVGPDFTGGSRDVAVIVRRREMMFVDGEWMRQVLSLSDLVPGTFFVDESDDRVYLNPPAGTDIQDATVEVAVRDRVWDQAFEHNVTIRGLTFQHANEAWTELPGAARFASSDGLLIEQCTFQWNNYVGLELLDIEEGGAVVRHTTMNHNGADGWGMFRVKNVVIEDSETSFNNWRGHLGGFHGWSVGNKILSAHGLTIRRHTAHENRSRGLWIDFDNENVVLEELDIRNNLLDGIWFEANQGPIVLRNSSIRNNGASGVRSSYSEHVRLEGNVVANNHDAQIFLIGGGVFGEEGREVENFETNEELTLYLKNWSLVDNVIVGGEALVTTQYFERSEWQRFASTLASDHNTWWHSNRNAAFRVLDGSLSFAQWQNQTGEDDHSSFQEPSDLSVTVPIQDTLPLDFTRDPVGTKRSMPLDVDIRGAVRGVAHITASDIDSVEEIILTLNGLELNIPSSLFSSGGTVTDSFEVSIDKLVQGTNTITVHYAKSIGASDGFLIRDMRVRPDASTGTFVRGPTLPRQFLILANYPDPFSNSTRIVFDLPEQAQVSAEVFDIRGRRLLMVPPVSLTAGSGRNLPVDASLLSSGFYLYRLTAAGAVNRYTGVGQFFLVR